MNKETEYETAPPPKLEVRESAEEYVADQLFTYEDYCSWGGVDRWELIDGRAIKMEAPNRYHQEISMGLSVRLYLFLEHKSCKVYHAPFDVRLNVGEGKDTVVQTDLVVFCDHTKLDYKGAKGAPDFLIEILSPSTATRDRTIKLQKYEQYGVKEVWIVDPLYQAVTVYVLNERGKYTYKVYQNDDSITSLVLTDFTIGLEAIFVE